MNDQSLYQQLKGMDVGAKDDNYFRSLDPRFGRGRQDALDFMHRMRQSDPEEIAKRQKAEMEARFAADRTELAGYNDRYAEAVPRLMGEASARYDVGGKLNITTKLGDRIADLRNNISGYGAGGYASSGQVDSAVNKKYLPAYNQSSSNLATAAQLAQQDVTTGLLPIQTEGQILVDRMARESTGYSQQAQSELDVLLSKWTTNMQMAENEKGRLHELAMKEREYEEIRNNPGTEIVTVGGRKLLINKATGETVKDLGSSSEGGAGSAGAGNYLMSNNPQNQVKPPINSFVNTPKITQPIIPKSVQSYSNSINDPYSGSFKNIDLRGMGIKL